MRQNSLNYEVFQEINWKKALKEASERNVDQYHPIFFEKAEELEDDGRSNERAASRLLGDICTMHMNDDNYDNPFGPQFVTSNGRSAIVDDFSEDDLDVLDTLLNDIGDAELKARVADIIWTTRRDHQAAEAAFEAYLESAESHLDPSSWSTSFERIERAFQIATMLQNEDLRDEGRNTVVKILDDLNGEDPKFLSYNLLKLLFEHELGGLSDLSQRTGKAAKKAEESKDYRKAKKLWLLKANIDQAHNDEDSATNAKIRAGENILTIAEVEEDRSNSATAYHLSEAVEVFRRAGASEKAEQTHKLLLDAQKVSVGEMSRFETTLDPSDVAQEAREAVSDKDLAEAVKTFALITNTTE